MFSYLVFYIMIQEHVRAASLSGWRFEAIKREREKLNGVREIKTLMAKLTFLLNKGKELSLSTGAKMRNCF